MPQTEEVGQYTVFIKKKLGRGGFGVVYRAEDRDGKEIAAKQIECGRNQSELLREAELYLRVPKNHKNIIPIHDVKRVDEEDEIIVWIFMDLCGFGDLNKFSRHHPEKFSALPNKISLMQQIACGLEFLHEANIVHRDIKPANILLAKDESFVGGAAVKITDFGLCKFLDPHDMSTGMSTNVGTQYFKAPEFWDRGSDGKVRYNKGVDVFAAGLTYLSMIQSPNPDGQLVPKIEGPTQDSEKGNPIGQTLHYRQRYNQPALILVKDNEEDEASLKIVKEIIRRATRLNSEERPTSREISEELKQLPDTNVRYLHIPLNYCIPFYNSDGKI